MNDISREQLEAMIVTTIMNKLEKKEISGDRAKEIAKIVLDMIPENMTPEQIMAIIPQLDDQISELTDVVFTILHEHDENFREEELLKVRAKIQALINQNANI